ncbi:MAG TPA: ABC transporter permease [bacterium]|nr:ABC transporter permease [bacterium]
MSVKPVVKKEFIQIARDTRTLFMLAFFPATLLLVFGYVLSFDVKEIKLGIFDNDRSEESSTLISAVSATEYFIIGRVFENRSRIDSFLDDGTLDAVIIIPEDFGKNISSGKGSPVQVMIDGSDGRSAGIVQGYIAGFINSYSQKVIGGYVLGMGGKVEPPVNIEPRIWYNPELKSSIFLVAGLIVFILMITGVISTALSVVREREKGTMEQLLVSPLSATAVIIGKTIPYLVISLLSTVIILVTGYLAFGVEVKGSYLMLFVSSTLFIMSALAQGILISTITTSQQVAFFAASLSSLLPALLLSGFIFPIAGMPYIIQAITTIVPAKYFVNLLRGIIMRGSGFDTGLSDLAALTIFSFVLLTISVIRLKKVKLV